MTITEIRDAYAISPDHADLVISQHETQVGSALCDDLWAELDRLIQADYLAARESA